jgi:hypothetical protein
MKRAVRASGSSSSSLSRDRVEIETLLWDASARPSLLELLETAAAVH